MNKSSIILLNLLVIFIFIYVNPIYGRLREGECEVCLKCVNEFKSNLSKLTNQESIENGIKKICKSYKDKAEKRFCYYIGGSDDAATSLLRTISGPLKNHMPTELICEKLKPADGEICAIRYDKPKEPVDYSKVDFNKLRVKELKQILNEWNEKCEKCTEKSEYLALIKQVLHKHVPNAKTDL